MSLIHKAQATLTYMTCLVLVCSVPIAAYAVEEEPTTTSEPTAAETTQLAPDPAPTTTEASPAPVVEPQKTYTFDAATGRWNGDDWQYDAATNTYVPTPQITPTPPSSDQSTVSQSEPQTYDTDNNNTSTETSTTTSSIKNAIDSLAETGSAGVLFNSDGGNATTGDAAATALIMNNLNSTVTNTNNKEAATFVTDVMGDVNGDILLQPMLLKAMLEAKLQPSATQQNVSNTSSITNDIGLTAISGDADVQSNTSAGDATTGSANTVADVVNMVNSMVSANQSFVGTINIYGNLNGDILIAPDFLPKLLESNGGPESEMSSTKLSSQDTQTIVNNVALAAESGSALIENNTGAGNALTGSAATNLVIFNLSGHEIVASNSLLVFVNVLGTWVGVIVDAPIGATAAAIADNVSTDNRTQPSMEIDVVNKATITNNLILNSKSGDATVARNTLAGNATSGNATASANIANISNSSLGLSGWFGILFINVFGSWIGSFGVDTEAGNVLIARDNSESTADGNNTPQVIKFISKKDSKSAVARTTIVTPQSSEQAAGTPVVDQASAAVQSNSKEPLGFMSDVPLVTDALANNRELNMPLIVGSFFVTLLSLYALRRFLF